MAGPHPSRSVAIIGLACTYPGARNASKFWQNIVNKVDAITDVTPDRWDPDIFYDPDPANEDRIYCKKGGWIEGSYSFNPLKYGIMPSALEGTEADHFLALRTAYEALEDAGYAGARKIDGERVSIILGKGNYTGPGVTNLMYRSIVTEQVLAILKSLHPEFTDADMDRMKAAVRATLPKLTPEGAAGLIPNICTGRVANRLDFMGRNFTIDAACASSLIATEVGFHDLNEGRADLVLAGGIHVFAHIPFLHVFDTMRALSFTSTIRPFDEDCDGTMSGEGAGVLVLKRLEDAERDGDRIYAVIRGTGSASDGRAKGIVAPRPEGEELAMRRAYESSGVSPQTIELIEAHGTATSAGDAAEADAMRRVFGGRTGSRPTCAVGSVKSMIGHAMPASGAASLIKAALALYHRVLPPTLNCRKPRKSLVGGDSPFYVNTEARPWIRAQGSAPRRAGVSAFGFGGINAHIVLEEYTGPAAGTLLRDWPAEFLVLEGETRDALAASARAMRAYAARVKGVPLRDLAFTVNTSLRGLPFRVAVVAESLDDLCRKLQEAERRIQQPGILKDRQGIYSFSDSAIPQGKLAVLFPGEGAQYAGMLGELCLHFPEVRAAFDLADAGNTDPNRIPASGMVFPPPAFSEEETLAAESRLWAIDRATETVLTADAAIFRLLERLGIRADVMAGHSAGEWIGLAASGVLDPKEFFLSMGRLSHMYETLADETEIPRMSMLAVAAGCEKVERLIQAIGCEAQIANDNCQHQSVIVVAPQDEPTVLTQFHQHGVFVEKLPYDRGYHTSAFTYICEPLRQFFSSLQVRAPRVPLYSCSSASLYPDDPAAIVDTAANTFARPLLFRQTIERMYEDGTRIFVESGPRGNLTAFIDDILRGKPHLAVQIDQFRRPGLTTLNHALATLAAAHVPLDLGTLYESRSPLRLTLDADADSVPEESEIPGTVQISLAYPRLGVPPPLPARSRLHIEPELPPLGDLYEEMEYVNGDGVYRPAAFEPGDLTPLLDEHVAVMEDFLRTHEEVMRSALGHHASMPSGAVATATAPARYTPSELILDLPMIRSSSIVKCTPQESIELRTVLDVEEHRFLEDHCLYFRAPDPASQGSPLFSMPMTGSLEIMAEAASLLCPDLRVVGANRVQVMRWINVKKDERFTVLCVSALRMHDDTVHVTIRPEASGNGSRNDAVAEATIVFQPTFPEASVPGPPALRNPRQPAFTARTIYNEHLMFHGPSFQGIVSLEQIGENGVTGNLQVLPNSTVLGSDQAPRFLIDPFLLDAAGQMVGYWPVEYVAEGYVCLPIRIGSIELFRENLPPGSVSRCNVRIAELSLRQLRGDFDVVAPDGALWMRVQGWEDWRFYWKRHIHEFWRFPNRAYNGRAIEIPGVKDAVACQRIDPLSEVDKTGLWELLWLNMILNRNELAQIDAIGSPDARVEWIVTRAAAKDAARAWLKRHCDLDLYPTEVEIRECAGGFQVCGLSIPAAAGALHIAVHYSGSAGIAVASDRPLGVFVGPAEAADGGDLLEFACAAAERLFGSAPNHIGDLAFTSEGSPHAAKIHCARDGGLMIAVAQFQEFQ